MTSPLIRAIAWVTNPGIRSALEQALERAEGYDLTLRPVEEAGVGTIDPSSADVFLLELPASTGSGESTEPGHGAGDTLVERVLARARDRPVIVVGVSGNESSATRAVQKGSADALVDGTLYPAVIQRSVRYAVERSRAERRRERAERALRESEQRYRSLFEQSRDAIYMTDRGGEIVELNAAALDLLGYTSDELIGRDVRAIYADPEDRERFRETIEAEGSVRDFELRLTTESGKERWCLLSSWVRRDPSGKIVGYQGIIHDITERKSVEDQLAHEAFHDSLTGLPNRALFMDRLERAAARRRRGEDRDLAVLFLDMDRFKIVNDSMGHLAGDELLRRMAQLLREEIREEDTVARIGGDEFAILIDGVADAADPTHVAERIQKRLRTPFRIHGQDVFTSLSIGIALGGADIGDPESLLRSADTAMYRAKELGPARYQIYDQVMHTHAVTLLQVETDLRLALERDQLVLHYQPILGPDGEDGRAVLGFEALVRWDHPERGLIQPQSFIPVAEDTGLIAPLGTWVLREAISQLRQWRLDHPAIDDFFVAVNLAQRQFTAPDLTDTIARVLDEHGVEPRALRLEVTESAMMSDTTAAFETLNELEELGVTLCIDDFGTGYSSLHILHELPVDVLKIDRSFIQRIEDPERGHLVETLLSLARNLGMEPLAEGVETEGQVRTLMELGSVSVQGFYFSRPLDPDAAIRFLQDHRPLIPDH